MGHKRDLCTSSAMGPVMREARGWFLRLVRSTIAHVFLPNWQVMPAVGAVGGGGGVGSKGCGLIEVGLPAPLWGSVGPFPPSLAGWVLLSASALCLVEGCPEPGDGRVEALAGDGMGCRPSCQRKTNPARVG